MSNKWYPQAVTVGKLVTPKEIVDRLSQISIVSRADVYAVLMAAGGNRVDSEDKVNASQITGVCVHFIPEATKKSGSKSMNRSLISDNIFWMELKGEAGTTPDEGEDDRPEIE